jgi:hypothetical protein
MRVTPRTRFTPGKGPSIHWIEGWMGLRAGLNTKVRGKILCSCWGSNLIRPVCSQTLLTDLPQIPLIHYTMCSRSRLCHGSSGLSLQRPGFTLRSDHVGFVVDGFFSEFFGFPLPISFHHCSILIYHCPMRCAIAPTKQHIIIPSVLS